MEMNALNGYRIACDDVSHERYSSAKKKKLLKRMPVKNIMGKLDCNPSRKHHE